MQPRCRITSIDRAVLIQCRAKSFYHHIGRITTTVRRLYPHCSTHCPIYLGMVFQRLHHGIKRSHFLCRICGILQAHQELIISATT